MSTLRIYALGHSLAVRDGGPLDFPTQKAFDLLCLLVLHPGEPLQRDWIAERLWPMRPPGRGRRCLSTSLWRLRRVVETADGSGEGLHIRADQDRLTFIPGSPYWLDVEQFERKAASGLQGALPCDEARAQALHDAIDLYRGDLLAGSYDDWCLAKREQLQLLLLRVLKRLQRHARLSGDFELGIIYGHRLLSLDSLQEDVHRELMRCHVDAGDPTRALEHFRRCREMLRSELQVEPMAATWELYHQMRGERRTSAVREVGVGSLASLESGLTQLNRALVALRQAQEALQAAAAEIGLQSEACSLSAIYPPDQD